MLPANVPLQVYRGDTYSWSFRLWVDRERTQPIDLTGVTPKAEIRDRAGGTLMLELPLKVELPNVIEADLSPEDGKKLTRHKGVWDMQLTLADGTVTTIIAGDVFVKSAVTDSA